MERTAKEVEREDGQEKSTETSREGGDVGRPGGG